jgi:hypothetical protein
LSCYQKIRVNRRDIDVLDVPTKLAIAKGRWVREGTSCPRAFLSVRQVMFGIVRRKRLLSWVIWPERKKG